MSRRLARLATLAGIALPFAITPAVAQAPTQLRAESYRTPDALVEVIGLRHWTLAMLRDSVRTRNPGLDLHDAACMAVLRQELGFRDALVNHVEYTPRAGAPTERYVLLKLVEPGDSARSQWGRMPADSFRVLRPAYAPLVLGATDSIGRFRTSAIRFPLQFGADTQRLAASLGRMPAPMRPLVEADAQRLRAFRATPRSASDWRLAMRVLRTDGAYENRVAAAVVLADFGDRDSTWLTLADAMRDGNEAVSGTAETTLGMLTSRPVDWSLAVPTLRALLGGTNVSATETVLELLVRTRVAPSLAGPLLGGNGEWVLAHLGAKYPGSAEAAHALLVQLNGGHDLGRSPGAWQQWIAELRADVRS